MTQQTKQHRRSKKPLKTKTPKGVASSRLVGRLRRIVTENGKWPYGSTTRVLDVVEGVFESHRRMCDNLQAVVQQYRLGLGGEMIDQVVCNKLRELLGSPNELALPTASATPPQP